MMPCVFLSILIHTETNIVLNKYWHYLVRASHDSGLCGTILPFHEWKFSGCYTLQNLVGLKAALHDNYAM